MERRPARGSQHFGDHRNCVVDHIILFLVSEITMKIVWGQITVLSVLLHVVFAVEVFLQVWRPRLHTYLWATGDVPYRWMFIPRNVSC